MVVDPVVEARGVPGGQLHLGHDFLQGPPVPLARQLGHGLAVDEPGAQARLVDSEDGAISETELVASGQRSPPAPPVLPRDALASDVTPEGHERQSDSPAHRAARPGRRVRDVLPGDGPFRQIFVDSLRAPE